jgi:hypothetical protein
MPSCSFWLSTVIDLVAESDEDINQFTTGAATGILQCPSHETPPAVMP